MVQAFAMTASSPPTEGFTPGEKVQWLRLRSWVENRPTMFRNNEGYKAAVLNKASRKRQRVEREVESEESYVRRYGPRLTAEEADARGKIVQKEIEDLFDAMA